MITGSHSPTWMSSLLKLLPIRSQFILSGNIRDKVLIKDESENRSITKLKHIYDALWSELSPLSYTGILVWDFVDGLRAFPQDGDSDRLRVLSEIGGIGDLSQPQRMDNLSNFGELLRRISSPQTCGHRLAVIADFSSRIRASSEHESQASAFFTLAEKAAQESEPMAPRDVEDGEALHNPIFWLVNRPVDIPFWLSEDNEKIVNIPIPLPETDTRIDASRFLFGGLPAGIDQDNFSRAVVNATDGLTLNGLKGISVMAEAELASSKDIGEASRILEEAVRSYRIGQATLESPWRSEHIRHRISDAESGSDDNRLEKRVMGQERAVNRVLDILKRTSIGLTGAQTRGSASRPRGIMFFAGPTGVGKTEMAKAIAKIVFGDDSAYRRFDMSEFSAEHSADRLIGAPPGYVGFEQGGELTNAIRERPFRVLLFDEIEKAHDKILDKFLQILEDGRLTDGRGQTVYFSDSLIVFTSNAGLTEKRADGSTVYSVTPEECFSDPNDYEQRVIHGVREFFISGLERPRPELFNRMGENVVVFNFISETVGEKILSSMTNTVIERTRDEHNFSLVISDQATKALRSLCLRDLSMGGRGVGSRVEAILVNPLARYLFESMPQRGSVLTITDVHDSNNDGIFEIAAE